MRQLLQILKILVPSGVVVGGTMELFMIKTNFYETATRKKAERLLEEANETERLKQRMKDLNIVFTERKEEN